MNNNRKPALYFIIALYLHYTSVYNLEYYYVANLSNQPRLPGSNFNVLLVTY